MQSYERQPMMKPAVHFPVEVTFAFQRRVVRETIFTPESWKAKAEVLADVRDRRLGPGRCLVDWPNKAAQDSPEEHVIPKASGIKWIFLPKGLVSQSFNSRASAWELEFFRKGMLGALRPFYVFGHKEIVFGDQNGGRVVFRNSPQDGFRIETHGVSPLPEVQRGGSGAIRFCLPVEYPPTRLASREITKIAYLVLAVINPEIALSDALSDVRTYLVDDQAPYRAYGELFCPRRPGGVSVSYLVNGRHVIAGQCEISSIFAKVLIHHVQFVVHLVGAWPDQHQPAEDEITWHLAEKPAERRSSTIMINYDEAVPRTPEAAQPAVAADGNAAGRSDGIEGPPRRRPHR